MSLPKPTFLKCDETSISLSWEPLAQGAGKLSLQYKEPPETWEEAREIALGNSQTQGATLNDTDLVDLKPGTPYFVRLALTAPDGVRTYGPENVFDTKPIDCGPKGKKSCIIS